MQAHLVTFASTHAALAFEDAAERDGALVPVPPTLRAGCGMAWRLVRRDDGAARERVEEVAAAAGLAAADWELYAQEEEGGWRGVVVHGDEA